MEALIFYLRFSRLGELEDASAIFLFLLRGYTVRIDWMTRMEIQAYTVATIREREGQRKHEAVTFAAIWRHFLRWFPFSLPTG